MTTLATEVELEIELVRLHREWEAAGYPARRFYQMFMKHCKRYKGGIAAVRNVVAKSGTGGFDELVRRGRLDLTLERAIVLNHHWTHLFSKDLYIIAQHKVDTISK